MTIDYALTACFGYGAADFLSGFATRKQSVAATLLIGQPVAFIAIGIAAALTPGHPNWPDMALGMLAGTVGGVGKTLLYQSLARDTMAMASTVFGILSAAVPVTAGLLFGNRPSWLQIAGIVLAVHAIYALQHSHHAGPGQPSRAVLLMPIAAGCALGVYHVLLSCTSAASGLWPLAAARTAPVVGIIAYVMVQPPEGLTSRGVGLSALATLVEVSATMLALLAVRADQLAIAGTLIALSPAITITLAHLLLHEHIERNRIVGLMLSLLAIGFIVA